MFIASVQLRLLGEGEAVEMARRALMAFTSPDVSISIQRSIDRSGHHSATAFGTILINTSSESVASERIVLALTPQQVRVLQHMIAQTLQQSETPTPELETVQWLLTINEQGLLPG